MRHSADARTALIAMYIAQYANPQAGMGIMRATPCGPQPRGLDAEKGKRWTEEAFLEPLGARGRTIYNADAYPKVGTTWANGALEELARIDAEEARRAHWGQFSISVREEYELSSSGPTGSSGAERMAAAEAEDMFALYIEV